MEYHRSPWEEPSAPNALGILLEDDDLARAPACQFVDSRALWRRDKDSDVVDMMTPHIRVCTRSLDI